MQILEPTIEPVGQLSAEAETEFESGTSEPEGSHGHMAFKLAVNNVPVSCRGEKCKDAVRLGVKQGSGAEDINAL